MSKTLKITLAIISGIVLSALIFGAGMMVGRISWGDFIHARTPGAGMGWTDGRNHPGYSMMGGHGANMGLAPASRMGKGGRYQPGNGANIKPLTVDQAKQAIEGYLKGLNNADLELKEVMIFDQNAYARVTEKSTGIGAMELLIDSVTHTVFPEYGANMMWNLKYGKMSMRGGMGRNNYNPGSVSATMTVTADQAVKTAQQYLDQQFPGYQAATSADPFYGYYTIDILKDGKPTGMLSVNGFSGQIFLHTWHGTFIEKSE